MKNPTAGALMIQGTGSNVGKSLLVAGLCRAARLRGLSVAPFKPQNMSNNAAVTVDGGEIGRAQALQALACGLEPATDMNPVLLKPETDTGAQVILHGRAVARAQARDYATLKPQLLQGVLDSFARLRAAHDLVIVEGAGSPAEVNLRPRDIANMGFARAAGVPVVLAGDIDRGGVIAQIVGTRAVIEAGDAAMIRGFLINKFRGDPVLLQDGYRMIEERTGWRGFGVVPWFPGAHRLPAEDAVDLRGGGGQGAHVVCLTLSRIANFDDLDPLATEPGLRLTMLGPGRAIPGDADLVIIPGTKSTRGDLAFLRQQGWDIDLTAHLRRGGHVLGICGGYQMLGRVIRDPMGFDGPAGETEGLGLLDIQTEMAAEKRLTRVQGRALGQEVTGYEIHMGRTSGPDCARPFAHIPRADGAISADGRVSGTYLHGLFADDGFRAAWLARLGVASAPGYAAGVQQALDDLAAHLETHLDVDGLLALAG
ncbi:adenosylcobyric acid synthase (glutamine-hydrolysing) [Paracoccus alcaliphilus]|uniref:Cobyric acid synthase n=2 Tax=Paracoccus alcaliphilus TaxID=34002 RepID=A0A1H8FMS5_9RHOB|nr:cobyric acid synthase [Paracoccus alcaliphilus]WCR19361.1 cobyric acid synthase [Paracoccus alcaliphilus]SEN32388.1 adenosylcobyric acid synthase (glutamine-hydrolysing) [Paracoccus alcaliphilus]